MDVCRGEDDGGGHGLLCCAVGFQQGYRPWMHPAAVVIGLLGCDMGTGGRSHIMGVVAKTFESPNPRLWLNRLLYGGLFSNERGAAHEAFARQPPSGEERRDKRRGIFNLIVTATYPFISIESSSKVDSSPMISNLCGWSTIRFRCNLVWSSP
jgi:hypothetical protein